jgi:SRSO17 transposase
LDRIAPRFARYEPLRHAGALMTGMVSGLDRKNCWTIAEHRGAVTPDGLQHLLARPRWDAEAVRDDLRDYVVDAFGDRSAILVVDETRDVKKGTATVGVQRQYSGTAGRIENSQVAVYLTYAAPRGHALIDRALYLPKSWTEDSQRCAEAGGMTRFVRRNGPVRLTAMTSRQSWSDTSPAKAKPSRRAALLHTTSRSAPEHAAATSSAPAPLDMSTVR